MIMDRSRRRFHFSPWPIALPLCAIAMAVGVFVVTQSVQRREAHVGELNRQLLSEQQTLRVLDAEWAYLTRPQRLEELMAMKVDRDVMPPTPTPVANVVPAQPDIVAAIEPAAGASEVPVAAPKKKIVKVSISEDKPVVKKAASKKAAVKAAPKIAAAKNAMDGAWHIAPKKSFIPQRTASLPTHAGIARPIVE
jgi:hypothetical protein